MSAIDTAVVLAAGAGTRLVREGEAKPLCGVGGRPLIDWAIEKLASCRIERIVVVTGYSAGKVEAHLVGRQWPAEVVHVRTADWRLPNGVSARAAAPLLGEAPALLVMCDHLVDPELYTRVARAGADKGLTLGIDRRLGQPWVDPDDVTCVRTEGDRIVTIGKGVEPHDAYDTGVFAVGPPFFDALAAMEAPSISDAVTALARAGAAWTVDCSGLDWIDVDDAAALAKAEQAMKEGRF